MIVFWLTYKVEENNVSCGAISIPPLMDSLNQSYKLKNIIVCFILFVFKWNKLVNRQITNQSFNFTYFYNFVIDLEIHKNILECTILI